MEFIIVLYRKYFYLLMFVLLHFSLIGQSPGIPAADYDGNIYSSVIIGSQTWLTENLNSLHYCDGTDWCNSRMACRNDYER